ncbi:MAG: hypothetical protein WCO45_09475 [Pseudanabaena sp. ELA607]
MEGKILDYNSETKQGLIKSTDGNRYEFVAEEYRNQTEIKIGQNVDFQAEADNKATAIYLLKGELAGMASAAAESFGKVLNKDKVDKLAQSAKALAESEGVSKSAESIKQFLLKPFVLPIAGITFLVIVFFTFFRGDGLAGSTFSGYEKEPLFGNQVSLSIKFKSEGKIELLVGNSLQDGTYEIEGNSVKIRLGQNVYKYTRNGNNLELNGGRSVLKKE